MDGSLSWSFFFNAVGQLPDEDIYWTYWGQNIVRPLRKQIQEDFTEVRKGKSGWTLEYLPALEWELKGPEMGNYYIWISPDAQKVIMTGVLTITSLSRLFSYASQRILFSNY